MGIDTEFQENVHLLMHGDDLEIRKHAAAFVLGELLAGRRTPLEVAAEIGEDVYEMAEFQGFNSEN